MGVQINGDTGNVIATKGTYSGNVTIGGTLTYEDVTNIDSVGLVTARNGIEIGARPGVAASISVDGNAIFSGITTVGGNLSIADKIIHTGNTDTSIRFPEGNIISAEINGSEALRVGAGGSVGIGTDVPDTLLHLYGSSSTQKLLTFGGGNSKRNNYIGISGADNLEIGVDEHDEGSGSTFRIRIDGAEKARITSGGLLLVGHDSSTGSGKIQASTAGQDGIDILGYNSTAGNGGRLTFYRSKNATIGSNTEVADNDSLGRIDWRGYNDDGTAFNIGATIEAEVDGAVNSTTDMPSALLFKTSADGSSSPTERFRITADGKFGFGTDSPSNTIHILAGGGNGVIEMQRDSANTTGNVGVINFTASDGHSVASVGAYGDGDNESAYINFKTTTAASDNSPFTSTSERMRIHANGDVCVGTTSSSGKFRIKSAGNGSGANALDVENSDNDELFRVRNDGAIYLGVDTGSPYNFTGGSANLNIQSSGRVRRVSSSIRYKKDIQDATWGLADVLKLRPITYKSNGTGENEDDHTYGGFTAEDIHDIGLTDFVEYNENNEPDALHYPNMVALMAKAIQELKAEVDALKSN